MAADTVQPGGRNVYVLYAMFNLFTFKISVETVPGFIFYLIVFANTNRYSITGLRIGLNITYVMQFEGYYVQSIVTVCILPYILLTNVALDLIHVRISDQIFLTI